MTRRVLVLGSSQSGKSFYAKTTRKRWPYSVYVDTQHQVIENVIAGDVPTPAFWERLRGVKHVAIRLSNATSLKGWYSAFLAGLQKLRHSGFNDDVLFQVDESASYGLSHYASHVQVFDDLVLRSRMWHSVYIILHDLRQAPSTLMEAGITDIIQFRMHPSVKGRKYLADRYPQISVLMQKVERVQYSYVHYDVMSQRAQWCAPVRI